MPRPTLTTFDGIRLAGRRWRTDGMPRAAVVLVHGFTASADCPRVTALADALHGDGLDVVAYSARGHGESEGECTLGDLERHDVAAAVALARERTPTVVIVGASMGAIAVVRHAAHDAELAGVVTVSCPAEWRLPRNVRGFAAAAVTRTAPGRALLARFARVRVAPRWTGAEPPRDLAARVRAPFAIVHGADDPFISSADAEVLHEAATGPRRIEIVHDLGHAFEAESVDPVRDAVAWALAESGIA